MYGMVSIHHVHGLYNGGVIYSDIVDLYVEKS